MGIPVVEEPLLDTAEIQGHGMRGFDTAHLELIGFKFGDAAGARAVCARLAEEVANLAEVHDFRLRRSAGDTGTFRQVLLNAVFSTYGLRAMGIDGGALNEGLFNLAMGKLAASLGDRVEDYVTGQDKERTPDLLLLMGCDDPATLTTVADGWEADAASRGLRRIYRERGSVLPGEIEHFGYRDGISQMGPRGRLGAGEFLTLRRIDPADPAAAAFGKPGQPLVWPGQFVFGYPTQTDDPLQAGPVAKGPEWAHNGSLVVFRRLRQDVAEFRKFLESAAAELSLGAGRTYTADQVGAAVVGRWQDGTPTVVSPEAPVPEIARDGDRVNHFGFSGVGEVRVADGAGGVRSVAGHASDLAGERCPAFAHVRKVNPRGVPTDQGEKGATLRFQMLRRGIPYGAEYRTETAGADRGLLFLGYQTSFSQQFRILNNMWMNNPDAPEAVGEGHDLLLGQAASGTARFGVMKGRRVETLARWVVSTGGAFLFSPAVGLLGRLGRG